MITHAAGPRKFACADSADQNLMTSLSLTIFLGLHQVQFFDIAGLDALPDGFLELLEVGGPIARLSTLDCSSGDDSL